MSSSVDTFRKHTGFNVHSKVRARDRKETERVGKYMIRSLLLLQRLSFDETEGKVCYQYDKSQPREERMDYLEFILSLIVLLSLLFCLYFLAIDLVS